MRLRQFCTIEECTQPLKGRGLCDKHYSRSRYVPKPVPVFPQTFWPKVDKSGDCWLWKGATDKDGYGRFNQRKAHRVMYELMKGAIPTGLLVCHTCDNPPCVNPDHLWAGTQRENVIDCHQKHRNGWLTKPGRWPRGEQKTSAKLTESDVSYIKAALRSGVLRGSLAKQFSVSYPTIDSIYHGRKWQWVE